MKVMKFLAVFTLGIGAGAVAALCYAPQAGKKTRRRVQRSLTDATGSVKDRSGALAGKAEKVYRRTRKRVGNAVVEAAGQAQSQAEKTARRART